MTADRNHRRGWLTMIVAVFVLSLFQTDAASATGNWNAVKVTPANPIANVVTSMAITEGTLSPVAISCLKLTVDNNSAFNNVGLPAGFAFNSGAPSTLTGWTPGTAAGKTMTWTSAGITPANGDTFNISNVHTPTAAGAYYLKIETFGNSNCTAAPVDTATVGFFITSYAMVIAHVQPTLSFTVSGRATGCNGQSGTVVDNSATSASVTMGHINVSTAGAGAQDVAVTTNAASGAVVYVHGDHATGNMRGATHEFTDSGSTAPTPGTESFGYTAADPHRGMAPNEFATLTDANAEIAYSSTGDVAPSCIGYQAAAARTTPSGAYSATVTYTAVPSF